MKVIYACLLSSCFALCASEKSHWMSGVDTVTQRIISHQIDSEQTALDGLRQVSKLALSSKSVNRMVQSESMVRQLLDLSATKTNNLFGALYLLKATGRVSQAIYDQLHQALIDKHPQQHDEYQSMVAQYSDSIGEFDCDQIEKAIDAGVDPHVESSQPMFLESMPHPGIFAAIVKNNSGLVSKFLAHPACNVNYAVERGFGYTPLHRAALSSRPEIVKLLVNNRRVDPNARTTRMLQNPLVHLISEIKSQGCTPVDMMKNALVLVDSDRVSIACFDRDGKTAVHYAASADDSLEPLIAAISKKYPLLNIEELRDVRGRNPLWYALSNNHTRIIEAVQKHEKNRISLLSLETRSELIVCDEN